MHVLEQHVHQKIKLIYIYLCSESETLLNVLPITDGAKSAYYSSINGLKDFGSKLTSLTSDIGSSLKSAAGSLDHLFTDQIGGSLSSVGTGLVDGAKDVWSSISSGATDVANSISSGAKDVVNTIGSGLSSIGHSIGRKYRQKESLFRIGVMYINICILLCQHGIIIETVSCY